jgi:amino-acid N-acetyltransferase
MSMNTRVTLRTAEPADAKALHALISKHLEEGHLLPRRLDELTVHASRFIVAVRDQEIVGCAELAPLSSRLAEVRSLAVDASVRGQGVGTRLIAELRLRGLRDGYDRLSVLTHAPHYFINFGFSIVPHLWLQEKVFTDCVSCPKFRSCGQVAMVVPLVSVAPSAQDEPTAVLEYA